MELLAVETLLENGVPLPIRAPFFFRCFGVKTLRIYQPSLGNKLRINRLYLSTGITDAQLKETTQMEADRLMNQHAYTHARMLAIGMMKGLFLPWILNRVLGLWLKWNLSPQKIFKYSEMLVVFSGTSAFMNTTRLFRGMKITEPNLGQKPQGS